MSYGNNFYDKLKGLAELPSSNKKPLFLKKLINPLSFVHMIFLLTEKFSFCFICTHHYIILQLNLTKMCSKVFHSFFVS